MVYFRRNFYVHIYFGLQYFEYIISDTGVLQELARVMICDCRYDVSYMLCFVRLLNVHTSR